MVGLVVLCAAASVWGVLTMNGDMQYAYNAPFITCALNSMPHNLKTSVTHFKQCHRYVLQCYLCGEHSTLQLNVNYHERFSLQWFMIGGGNPFKLNGSSFGFVRWISDRWSTYSLQFTYIRYIHQAIIGGSKNEASYWYCIVYCLLCIVYCVLCIVYFVLCIMHSAQWIVQCTVHSTQYTAHSTHSTVYIVHSTHSTQS